jgi:hypothetical protein
MTTMIFAAYGAIALLVATHGLVHQTGRRPRDLWMTHLDRVALGMAAMAVGALWVVFVPGLVYHAYHTRAASARRRWEIVSPRQVTVRS